MCELVDVVCPNCHGVGKFYSDKYAYSYLCSVCEGTGTIKKSLLEIIEEERDRAIRIIRFVIMAMKDTPIEKKWVYDKVLSEYTDLATEIFEREHPEEEVPW